MNFRLSTPRLIASLVLFVTLAFITLFIRDSFIRPFLGDVLVVVWGYCSVTAVIHSDPKHAALGVLLLAFGIEAGQYVQILTWFSAENNPVLRVIFGATFDWLDMLAYSIGAGMCWRADLYGTNPTYQGRNT